MTPKIYELTWTGRIKELKVLSVTSLPRNYYCFDIEGHGFKTGKNSSEIKSGTSTLYIGVAGLKKIIRNEPEYVKSARERLLRIYDEIPELERRIIEYDEQRLTRTEFIQMESEKYSEQLGAEKKAIGLSKKEANQISLDEQQTKLMIETLNKYPLIKKLTKQV